MPGKSSRSTSRKTTISKSGARRSHAKTSSAGIMEKVMDVAGEILTGAAGTAVGALGAAVESIASPGRRSSARAKAKSSGKTAAARRSRKGRMTRSSVLDHSKRAGNAPADLFFDRFSISMA